MVGFGNPNYAPPTASYASSPYSASSYYGSYRLAPRSATGFCGLSNPGATCYMNSLLQTLYMSFDFRAKLNEWKYDADRDGDAAECIAFQLQAVFGRLQLSKRLSVETKELTKSFGWTGADAFTQHDVQELNRVLLDALEKTFRGSPLANMVNDLYQGQMTDQIECKECGHVSARMDTFLDLQLVIRGSKTVEECLDRFVEQELMDGDNQYSCEPCGKKVDALKGLKLKKLPYLLTLQLMRFDYDWNLDRRIKLNDEVSFPLFLDMNPYVDPTDTSRADQIAREKAKAEAGAPADDAVGDDSSDAGAVGDAFDGLVVTGTSVAAAPADSDEAIARQMAVDIAAQADMDELDGLRPSTPPMNDNEDGDEDGGAVFFESELESARELLGLNEAARGMPATAVEHLEEEAAAAEAAPEGEPDAPTQPADPTKANQYELYSILIHSGSAGGGHYYAYIKDFESGTWFEFNDSTVSRLSKGDIERAFGGTGGGSTYSTSRSANAYMLVYRLWDPERNVASVSEESVPALIREMVEKENGEFERKVAEFEETKNDITLRLVRDGKDMGGLTVSSEKTVREAHALVYEHLKLADEGIASDCMRMRRYVAHSGVPGPTFEGQEDKSLNAVGYSASRQLMVETKAADETFSVVTDSDVYFKVRMLEAHDATDATFSDPRGIYFDASKTVGALRAAVAEKFDVDAARAVLVVDRGYEAGVLADDAQTVVDAKLANGAEVYLEVCPEACDAAAYESVILLKLDEKKHGMTIFYSDLDDEDGNKFPHELHVDRRWPLGKLRSVLAEVYKQPDGHVRLFKGRVANLEMKKDKESLQVLAIGDRQPIIVKTGKPLLPTEFSFTLSVFQPEYETATNAAGGSFGDSVPIVVSQTDTVREVKEAASKLLGIEADKMRMREKYSARLAKVYADDKTLKECIPYLVDGREIGIQLVDGPEEWNVGDVLFSIQQWDPSEGAERVLGTRHEMILRAGATLGDLGAACAEKLDIPPEFVLTGKPFVYKGIDLAALARQRWEEPCSEANKNIPLTGAPMYVRDGEIVIVLDSRTRTDAPSAPALGVVGSAASAGTSTGKGKGKGKTRTAVASAYRREEKALKIRTKYDEEDEAERKRSKG